jgi:hypothetical protein
MIQSFFNPDCCLFSGLFKSTFPCTCKKPPVCFRKSLHAIGQLSSEVGIKPRLTRSAQFDNAILNEEHFACQSVVEKILFVSLLLLFDYHPPRSHTCLHNYSVSSFFSMLPMKQDSIRMQTLLMLWRVQYTVK